MRKWTIELHHIDGYVSSRCDLYREQADAEEAAERFREELREFDLDPVVVPIEVGTPDRDLSGLDLLLDYLRDPGSPPPF